MEHLKSEVHFFSEVSSFMVFYKHMHIIFCSTLSCSNYMNLFAEMRNFLSTLIHVKWKGRVISLPPQNFDLEFDQLVFYFYCMFWMLWYGIENLQFFLYCQFCEVWYAFKFLIWFFNALLFLTQCSISFHSRLERC